MQMGVKVEARKGIRSVRTVTEETGEAVSAVNAERVVEAAAAQVEPVAVV